MTSHRIFPIALGVIGALLIACGDSSTANSKTAPVVDRAFAAHMIVHHQSAVRMAKTARRRGMSAFVNTLANDIVRNQTKEIATLRAADRRLRTAGIKKGSLGVPQHMTGMGDDMSMLESAKAFDRAFLKMMIPHHEGAVVMAKAELKKGKDPELKALARNIIIAQQREIREMRKHLGPPAASGDTMHDGHG